MKYFAHKLVLTLLLASSQLHCVIDSEKFVKNPKVIFFDVTETLIDVQRVKSAYEHFGLFDSVRALFQGKLTPMFTNFLAQIPTPNQTTENEVQSEDKISKIPILQREYLLGKLDSAQCIDAADKWVDQNSNKFINENQKNLFKKMIHFYFEPKTYYKYLAYTSCLDTMKKLHEVQTSNGKRKNIIFVVANESKEHIEELKAQFPDIFLYSDEQVFSSCEGVLKPETSLFEKCFAMCPANSYHVSFLVDKSSSKINDMFEVAKHRVEVVKPSEAESKLKAYGAFDSAAGI